MNPYDLVNPLDPFGGVPGDPMSDVLALQSYGVSNLSDACAQSQVSCPSNVSCNSNYSSNPPPPPSDPYDTIIIYDY
jgi:hypothetical protein